MNNIQYNFHNILESNLKSELVNLLKTENSVNQIVTLNLDNYRDLHYDEKYLKCMKSATFVTIDGVGLKLLLRLKHRLDYKIINGTDIFLSLFDIANNNNLSVGLIGASEEVKLLLEKKINNIFPNASICLKCTPQIDFENNEILRSEILNDIKTSSPEIVFVALGSPRQEKWIKSILQSIDVKIIVGIGSVFDTFSGKIKRAPNILQKIGLEWFWRLILEPRKMFNRYILKDIPFMFRYIFSDAKK